MKEAVFLQCQSEKCNCKEGTKRTDYYGISTGYWCNKCYNDSTKYPYKKGKYSTIEFNGYGECLENV